jgi:hypothetical protein
MAMKDQLWLGMIREDARLNEQQQQISYLLENSVLLVPGVAQSFQIDIQADSAGGIAPTVTPAPPGLAWYTVPSSRSPAVGVVLQFPGIDGVYITKAANPFTAVGVRYLHLTITYSTGDTQEFNVEIATNESLGSMTSTVTATGVPTQGPVVNYYSQEEVETALTEGLGRLYGFSWNLAFLRGYEEDRFGSGGPSVDSDWVSLSLSVQDTKTLELDGLDVGSLFTKTSNNGRIIPNHTTNLKARTGRTAGFLNYTFGFTPYTTNVPGFIPNGTHGDPQLARYATELQRGLAEMTEDVEELTDQQAALANTVDRNSVIQQNIRRRLAALIAKVEYEEREDFCSLKGLMTAILAGEPPRDSTKGTPQDLADAAFCAAKITAGIIPELLGLLI